MLAEGKTSFEDIWRKKIKEAIAETRLLEDVLSADTSVLDVKA